MARIASRPERGRDEEGSESVARKAPAAPCMEEVAPCVAEVRPRATLLAGASKPLATLAAVLIAGAATLAAVGTPDMRCWVRRPAGVRARLAGATTLPPPSVAEASVCVATFLTGATACPMLWVGALLIGAAALLTLCVTALLTGATALVAGCAAGLLSAATALGALAVAAAVLIPECARDGNDAVGAAGEHERARHQEYRCLQTSNPLVGN